MLLVLLLLLLIGQKTRRVALSVDLVDSDIVVADDDGVVVGVDW